MLVVVNGCPELVDHATAQKWVDAVQRQVANEFAAAWGVGAILHYAGDGIGEKPGPLDFVLRIVRDSSDAGTLGSHWFEDGRPVGECAVQTCLDENVEPPSCLDHEALELIVDPYGTMAFQVGRMMLAGEVSDRVEGSDPTYRIDGILMENFSLPSAFNGCQGPWDFRRRCTRNEILAGGYQLQVDLGSGQWTQATGPLARPSKRVAGARSRRGDRIARAGADPKKLALVTA